jgi:flavin reductase (DIM6/NTAB) family NADH-FMN oxidoreductase RutF
MSISTQDFKNVMAQWASGVTIVTTVYGEMPVGMTVSSFASASLQPPQILFGANRATRTHDAIARSGCFAVHILAVEHVDWGRRFAGLHPEVSDRFQGISWFTAQTGAPILPGVLGWLDCHVRQVFGCGDHTIFVGEVAACAVCNDGGPLLYHHRKWRQVAEQVLKLDW